MKGKYARRAANRQEAEGRYFAEVRANEALRSSLLAKAEEVTKLRQHAEALTTRVHALEAELAEATNPKIQELEKAASKHEAWIASAKRGMHQAILKNIDNVASLLDELGVPKESPAWWRHIADLAEPFAGWLDPKRTKELPPALRKVLTRTLTKHALEGAADEPGIRRSQRRGK